MNQFWVDPEGLGRSGEGYDAVRARLLGLQSDVQNIVDAYSGSFGGDDGGVQFRQNFNDSMGDYHEGIGGVQQSLGFVSDGLNINRKTYSNARDDSNQATYNFLTSGEEAGFGDDSGQGSNSGEGGSGQWVAGVVEKMPDAPGNRRDFVKSGRPGSGEGGSGQWVAGVVEKMPDAPGNRRDFVKSGRPGSG
ncbi:hypothetical protein ACFWY9_38585, partial [Amycolatopsis sp. NPDC059027]|uniref:hypothetical protein n=1 Tax=Amycolatopsis sp. NPDC059027 TaxID=3346709 RepID=UPI00366E387B